MFMEVNMALETFSTVRDSRLFCRLLLQAPEIKIRVAISTSRDSHDTADAEPTVKLFVLNDETKQMIWEAELDAE